MGHDFHSATDSPSVDIDVMIGSGVIGDESGVRNRVKGLLIFFGIGIVALDVGADFLNSVVDVLFDLSDELLGRVSEGENKGEVKELIVN